jgi:O-methyltransferase involved in polyketide biosynthesis
MEEARESNGTNRNFKTISPSAKSLLLMKGLTNIPFARQAAELMVYPEKYTPDFSNRDVGFGARIVHFESRYWSIDQLLSGIPIKNILELSSGFSFRGLETIKQKGFHYIDTDLPEVIAMKKDLIRALRNENSSIESTLETLPLNVFDEMQFNEIVNHFPEGEIIIVNEGLLMYLDDAEKEKLCKIIYTILKERGGYWITADIYIKNQTGNWDLPIDERRKHFFEKHHIEDNKFDSFEAAESFFKKVGFTIDKEAQYDRTKISSLKYLIANATREELIKIKKRERIQATWRLRVAGNLFIEV